MNIHHQQSYLTLILSITCCWLCHAIVPSVGTEYFSSVSGMEKLFITEMALVRDTQEYIQTLSNHIEELQSELDIIQYEHELAMSDLEGYLNNPVNSYRLIKRLHTDWTTFEDNIRVENSRSKILESLREHHEKLSFPTEGDVRGSAQAMVRLQDTYQLNVAEIASGILNGVKYGSSMSWQDCFLLGHNLFTLRDYNHTVPWLKQSMNMLFEQNSHHEDAVTLDFIETVAMYHQEMGDFKTALNLINHVLSIDDARHGAYETKLYLEQMVRDGVRTGLLYETTAVPGDYHLTNEYKLYERVCRSEVKPSQIQQQNLYCKYYTNNVAYRLLQPFKWELLNEDPYVVQLHDVLSDNQIHTVKRLAKPKIARSKVYTLDGANFTTSTYRISKTAWFKYQTHEVMQNMLTNFKDFSNLNMDAVEDLQVVNYGLGGHYEPHWDFFENQESYNVHEGNRIGTCIYYLSDVEEGGGTAFPFIPLLVKPTKGSILFWYNLHDSEEPDYRTKHAACPVLKGSKWIANIWIRVRGQEFNRLCGLKQEYQKSLIFKDYN